MKKSKKLSLTSTKNKKYTRNSFIYSTKDNKLYYTDLEGKRHSMTGGITPSGTGNIISLKRNNTYSPKVGSLCLMSLSSHRVKGSLIPVSSRLEDLNNVIGIYTGVDDSTKEGFLTLQTSGSMVIPRDLYNDCIYGLKDYITECKDKGLDLKTALIGKEIIYYYNYNFTGNTDLNLTILSLDDMVGNTDNTHKRDGVDFGEYGLQFKDLKVGWISDIDTTTEDITLQIDYSKISSKIEFTTCDDEDVEIGEKSKILTLDKTTNTTKCILPIDEYCKIKYIVKMNGKITPLKTESKERENKSHYINVSIGNSDGNIGNGNIVCKSMNGESYKGQITISIEFDFSREIEEEEEDKNYFYIEKKLPDRTTTTSTSSYVEHYLEEEEKGFTIQLNPIISITQATNTTELSTFGKDFKNGDGKKYLPLEYSLDKKNWESVWADDTHLKEIKVENSKLHLIKYDDESKKTGTMSNRGIRVYFRGKMDGSYGFSLQPALSSTTAVNTLLKNIQSIKETFQDGDYTEHINPTDLIQFCYYIGNLKDISLTEDTIKSRLFPYFSSMSSTIQTSINTDFDLYKDSILKFIPYNTTKKYAEVENRSIYNIRPFFNIIDGYTYKGFCNNGDYLTNNYTEKYCTFNVGGDLYTLLNYNPQETYFSSEYNGIKGIPVSDWCFYNLFGTPSVINTTIDYYYSYGFPYNYWWLNVNNVNNYLFRNNDELVKNETTALKKYTKDIGFRTLSNQVSYTTSSGNNYSVYTSSNKLYCRNSSVGSTTKGVPLIPFIPFVKTEMENLWGTSTIIFSALPFYRQAIIKDITNLNIGKNLIMNINYWKDEDEKIHFQNKSVGVCCGMFEGQLGLNNFIPNSLTDWVIPSKYVDEDKTEKVLKDIESIGGLNYARMFQSCFYLYFNKNVSNIINGDYSQRGLYYNYANMFAYTQLHNYDYNYNIPSTEDDKITIRNLDVDINYLNHFETDTDKITLSGNGEFYSMFDSAIYNMYIFNIEQTDFTTDENYFKKTRYNTYTNLYRFNFILDNNIGKIVKTKQDTHKYIDIINPLTLMGSNTSIAEKGKNMFCNPNSSIGQTPLINTLYSYDLGTV